MPIEETGNDASSLNADAGSDSAAERMRSQASEMLVTAKAKLGEIAEPIRDKAVEVAEDQKNKGADQVATAARAIHSAAGELEENMPEIARAIHDGGQWLQDTAGNLRDKNVDQLTQDFSDFARREPMLAFGGAVLAGLALSRFLKSSGARTEAVQDSADDAYRGA